jgi:Ca-activated chloride channel family protein
LLLSALICFIIGLANLRVGSKKEKVTGESAEIIICFDVSNSMLAEDVKPNRLAQSKFMVAQLIDKLAANKIGLIVFAGNSYVQMPLTHDARAALMYLDAIETALQEFKEGGADDERKGRAIIIVTDGESHDENAVEMAKQAAAMQIKIITLGVGTSEGAPIPIRRNGMIDGFKKDRAGNVVLTRLNEPLMSNLAAEADGEYRNIAQGKQVISDVAEIIDGLDKTKDGEYAYSDYANHFQLFLGIGLLLLIIEYLLSDRKPDWVKKINLFEQHEN